MSDASQKGTSRQEESSFVFKNGALQQLKDAARILHIPEDDLGQTLLKGIKFILLTENGKVIIEKGNERLEVDLPRL